MSKNSKITLILITTLFVYYLLFPSIPNDDEITTKFPEDKPAIVVKVHGISKQYGEYIDLYVYYEALNPSADGVKKKKVCDSAWIIHAHPCYETSVVINKVVSGYWDEGKLEMVFPFDEKLDVPGDYFASHIEFYAVTIDSWFSDELESSINEFNKNYFSMNLQNDVLPELNNSAENVRIKNDYVLKNENSYIELEVKFKNIK